jgi:transketolase
MIGMKTFGASAPLKELHGKFGFEPGRVVEAAKELLGTPTTDTGLRESQNY